MPGPDRYRETWACPIGTASIHTPSTGCKSHICNQFDVAVGIVMDGKQVHLSSLIIPVIELAI